MVLAALPYRTFDIERHAVPKELVLHLVAAMVAMLCLRRVTTLHLSRIDLWLLGYLGLSVVAALLATNWWLSGRALAISLSGSALFWSARSLGRVGLGRPLIVALAGAVILGALTALLQAYGLGSSLASLSRAPGGTFGNRNFMAHLVGLGLPTVILCALEARRRSHFVIWTVGMGVVCAALVLSRSRAAWLGCAAGLLFLGVNGLLAGLGRDRELRRRGSWLALALGLGVGLALILPNALDWRSDSPYLDSLRDVANYKEGSGRGRLIQYRNTMLLMGAHPLFGTGPGNWPVEYPRFVPKTDPSLDRDDGMTANPWPSSDWMAFASERGLPAFLLLLGVIGGLFFSKWRWWRADPDRGRDLAALTALAVLLIATVEGVFDAVLLLPAPTLVVWTILGALAPLSPSRRALTLTRGQRTGLLAAVGLLGASFTLRSTLQIRAMSAYSNDWSQSALERAARLDPGSYRIQIMLAESYVRRGGCQKVRAQAEAARRLFPNAPEPRRLLEACGK